MNVKQFILCYFGTVSVIPQYIVIVTCDHDDDDDDYDNDADRRLQ